MLQRTNENIDKGNKQKCQCLRKMLQREKNKICDGNSTIHCKEKRKKENQIIEMKKCLQGHFFMLF